MTGPDSEGLQAEAVERVKVARKALTERHATALAAASPIHWWDEKLLRELLVQAACPIMCVGYRQPGGTDWHEWCERKADAAMAALAGVLPPSSPVVPSVGAVPVEVPEEWARAAEHAFEFTPYAEMAEHAWPNVVRALYPLIAARVRAEERQRALAELSTFRDWHRSQDARSVVEMCCQIVAGGQVTVGGVEVVPSDTSEVVWLHGLRDAASVGQPLRWLIETVDARLALLAAGSAVPVATPTEPASCRCPTIEAYLAAPGAARAVGASFGCPVHGDRSDEAEAVLSARRAEQDGQR